jgi:hypothetical protein
MVNAALVVGNATEEANGSLACVSDKKICQNMHVFCIHVSHYFISMKFRHCKCRKKPDMTK